MVLLRSERPWTAGESGWHRERVGQAAGGALGRPERRAFHPRGPQHELRPRLLRACTPLASISTAFDRLFLPNWGAASRPGAARTTRTELPPSCAAPPLRLSLSRSRMSVAALLAAPCGLPPARPFAAPPGRRRRSPPTVAPAAAAAAQQAAIPTPPAALIDPSDLSARDLRGTVVVTGAGPAGLAAAAALHQAGLAVLLLERAPVLVAGCSALGLWTNAWRALEALGAADPLRVQHPELQE